ncbi:hypothetical protein OBBRIDRAFT_796288 [Obba rivulosa]|uniref:Uncharacterized protein n=1 Tax=Obba rivulosa TaxID=1052685 RepID=A0A8E2ASU0_9APHY|nr:hypothetical protein OBBRIDRAFT_796288 [Obba rivulosa]
MSSRSSFKNENRLIEPALNATPPANVTKTPKVDVPKAPLSNANANVKVVSASTVERPKMAPKIKQEAPPNESATAPTKVNNAQTPPIPMSGGPAGHVGAELIHRDVSARLRDSMTGTTISPNKAATKLIAPKEEAQSTSSTRGPSGSTSHPVASGSDIKMPSSPVRAPPNMHEPQDLPFADPWMDTDDEDEDAPFYHYQRLPELFPGPYTHGHELQLPAGSSAYVDGVQQFLLHAGNAEQFDGNESVDKAVARLGLRDQYHRVPGMTVALMPHQTIGVAWMLDKEKGVHQGGCLSDEMGLGKTVQMIAIVVANHSKDPLVKTNLVVAPLALLDQWKLEIETKTDCGLKCLIYHGPSKPRKITDLLKYDVILTTYQTLSLEWPDEEEEERKAKRRRKKRDDDGFVVDDRAEEGKSRSKKRILGPLLQVDWYRVILDEAQNIRNRRTRASRAVTKLEAKYRWCLTGTPIVNTLSDAYGLIRFLRIRPWYDWDEFNSKIARNERKNPQLAVERLQAIFRTMLIRRRKDSMLDGKRLVELLPKEISLVKLQFTLEERDIYKMVEQKSQAIFNRYLRAGTVLKNYHQVLVLLLRLRQICSHPCLIQEHAEAFIDPKFLEDKRYDLRYELDRARQLVSPEFVENMQRHFKRVMMERMEAEKQTLDATIEDEECPICFDTYTDAVVTPCAHVFCRGCILNVFNTEHGDDGANGEQRYKPDERPCPNCRAVIYTHKLFARRAFEPADEEDKEPAPAPMTIDTIDVDALPEPESGYVSDASEEPRFVRGKSLRKRKRQPVYDSDVEFIDDDDNLSDFIVESDEDEEEKNARRALKKRLGKKRAKVLLDSDEEMEYADIICGAKPDQADIPLEHIKLMPKFLPSTKMKHMMELLTSWANEHPDEKTLVVSQWTQCLQLVSDYLTEHGFLHVKYQGDMNRDKRDQAVRVFMSKDKATIMLMSLKCGGVGLNLTRANRVISLDLGWSEAVESQAFDRVHRLGQTRTTYVYRLVISDTVEDRVLALQERKKNLADGSLGEGTGKKMGKMSVRELAYLFGMDHRGRSLTEA